MRRDIVKTLNKIMMNDLDPHQINISIQSDLNAGGWLGESELQDSIIIYFVAIERIYDIESDHKEVIGNCICYYINGFDYARDSFNDLREIADSMSGDLLTAVAPLVDSNGQLTDDYIGNNILYIDHFYVKPDYRGKGIGSLCFPMIIDVLGRDASVISIIPSPTEDDGKVRIRKEDSRYKRIFNDMIRFYQKFGFMKINEVVWAQNTSLKN